MSTLIGWTWCQLSYCNWFTLSTRIVSLSSHTKIFGPRNRFYSASLPKIEWQREKQTYPCGRRSSIRTLSATHSHFYPSDRTSVWSGKENKINWITVISRHVNNDGRPMIVDRSRCYRSLRFSGWTMDSRRARGAFLNRNTRKRDTKLFSLILLLTIFIGRDQRTWNGQRKESHSKMPLFVFLFWFSGRNVIRVRRYAIHKGRRMRRSLVRYRVCHRDASKWRANDWIIALIGDRCFVLVALKMILQNLRFAQYANSEQ